MVNRSATRAITAFFSEPDQADAVRAALLGSGVPASAVEVRHGVLPEARGREGRFVWRVLVIIALWSIVGAIPGALFGLLLALTIGPEGTPGVIVQVVCWTIVGHLIGGMLAGYFVLADRRQEEMPPDRPVSVLTIKGLARDEEKRVRRLLRSRRPLELRKA